MPQQRRKVAFSGKKKKDQILQKRSSKGQPKYLRSTQESNEDSDAPERIVDKKLMEQPLTRGRNKNVNRYNLQFIQESKKEIELMKQEGFRPLDILTPTQREIDERYFEAYDFPVRPPWTFDQSKEQLERNENRYFKEYVDELLQTKRNNLKEHSLFELNLETWRQLWRVLEFSDILLIIVDVRYASLMFPPSLYDYIIHTIKKQAIVIFNKVDLVAAEAVVAWRHYFNERYPELPVVLFASYSMRSQKGTQRSRFQRAHRQSMEGVHNIYRECQKIVENDVDLSAWLQKIRDDMCTDELDDDEATTNNQGESRISNVTETTPHQHVKYNSGVLTIGCIGFPNVGKSSLINALKGRKVVSVSRTPGHTKHFQTIFLVPNVRVCDCPGLVFPSSTPKSLQVLLGSFPISQLQVPYRSLKLLAEHVNLPQRLRLHLPEEYDEWSAIAIADAWAYKRGFLTAKAARPDRYRAANHILRLCLSGQQQLIFQLYPPGYVDNRKSWSEHPDLAEVKKYQVHNYEPDGETNEDTSSICSDSEDSYDENSSNDETNADDDESDDQVLRSRNAFRLLDDN
ncbi:hypothetical protein AWZ03_011085 [Drosophila navojoa]|uniref:Guanine nucleotide-binding protein-like 1 n=1 Tax=Drosophila navojoa TaxID=7232 RepID=A0A484B344_DRONA|nr:guanine nucleotide-binding protein-like 1 [Drosophila navojoa]TDG42500.1 hypothetical protein AWZ03_011085 [Drosophila navojoa]